MEVRKILVEGKMRTFKSTGNDFSFDDLNKIRDAGFAYVVPNWVATGRYDNGPGGSGMPVYDREYVAFEDSFDAKRYIKVNKPRRNPYDGNSIVASPDSIDDLILRAEREEKDAEVARADLEKSIAKDRERASKNKEYRDNLPSWRKVRSKVLPIASAYNNAKREYDNAIKELKAALDAEGISYTNIEDVLSKEFLNNH